MELEKIRNLSDEELRKQETQAGEQLFRIRFQKSLGNTEGLKKLRTLKLDIARTKTIAREREIAVAKQANPAPVASAPAPSQRTARKKAKKG
jgi:large subunit ribosomal protein L29